MTASAIYIASPEGDTGKSTIALGLLHRLAATVAKAGVFRPITRTGEDRDYILELLLAHTTAGLPYEQCVGVSYQQLHDDPDTALADIVDRYHQVAEQCDAVLIVGSDYTDVAAPSELTMNARIAANLGAPVVLAVKAKDRTPEQVVQVVEVCLAEVAAQHAHTAAVVANRCEPSQMDAVAKALEPLAPKTYVLPEEPLLVAPSVAELQRAVEGTVLRGDSALLNREAMGVLVAGMTAEHVLERLTEGVAVITPGDRSDVVLAVLSAHAAEGFPSLSCVILNGGLELHPSIASLVSGLGLRLPMIETPFGTFETASRVASARGRVTTGSQRKIDTALALMDSCVDTTDLLAQLAIPIPSVVTPQMFTHMLLDRAREDRRHIVLPEGDDDRILQAAGRLLQRGVADLTILGEEAAVRARAAELGVDLSAAAVINPLTSELCDRFAEEYAELRKHKGVTVEQAREIIHDVSYFGTMLVHDGMVDGMVSGATAHHRAHGAALVRDHQDPARCVHSVEHLPDVPVRSGAGLRRLRDRARSDLRTTRRHRDLVGAHRRAVRHRPAGCDAFVLHRYVGHRCRCRQGQGGNRIGSRARTRSSRRGTHPVRRRGGAVGGQDQDARLQGRRSRDGADLPRPQHRQQHVQGGAAQRWRDRDRAGAAGPEQTGQRPVAGRAGRRHRLHRGHHRDPRTRAT